jgi:hypothetical protein
LSGNGPVKSTSKSNPDYGWMPLTKTFKETKVKEKLLFFLNLRSRGGKSYSIFELISIFKALSKWLYIIKIIV